MLTIWYRKRTSEEWIREVYLDWAELKQITLNFRPDELLDKFSGLFEPVIEKIPDKRESL